MKKILLICMFYSSFIPFTIHAMEKYELHPVYNPHHITTLDTTNHISGSFSQGGSLDELIAPLDDALKKQGYEVICGIIANTIIVPRLTSGQKSITDAGHTQKIMSIIQSVHPELSDPFITMLYEKHVLCKKIITHLISLAYQDIENVTCDTLKAIEHPELDQPTQKLNILPLAIKKYVMQRAKEKINASYERIFNNDEPIMNFTLSDAGGLVVTYCRTQGLTFWNFNKTNPSGRILSDCPQCWGFNKNGSRLVIAEKSNNQMKITEWNTDTENPTFTIQAPKPMSYITYALYNSQNILLSISYDDDHDTQQCWSTDNNNPSLLATITTPFKLTPSPSTAARPPKQAVNKYTARIGTVAENRLYVTKSNCHALKLCQLAVESAQKRKSLEKVTNSQSFQSLTEYEKNMVTKQMAEKRNKLTIELKKKKSKSTTETNPLLSTLNTLMTKDSGYTGSVVKL